VTSYDDRKFVISGQSAGGSVSSVDMGATGSPAEGGYGIRLYKYSF